MAPDFAAAAVDYHTRWNAMGVSEGDRARAEAVARRILQYKARYLAVESELGVPWHWIGLIHYREADLSFHDHLCNGESLAHRTTQVPAGRIPGLEPPYTWEQGAIDALRMRHLQLIKYWTFGQYCYQAEAYNGWGYRSRGVTSSYLWAHSNQHEWGKFTADHLYDPSAGDGQLGVLVVLRSLMALDGSISFVVTPAHTPEPLPAPHPDLVPKAQEAPEEPQGEPKSPEAPVPPSHESLLHRVLIGLEKELLP